MASSSAERRLTSCSLRVSPWELTPGISSIHPTRQGPSYLITAVNLFGKSISCSTFSPFWGQGHYAIGRGILLSTWPDLPQLHVGQPGCARFGGICRLEVHTTILTSLDASWPKTKLAGSCSTGILPASGAHFGGATTLTRQFGTLQCCPLPERDGRRSRRPHGIGPRDRGPSPAHAPLWKRRSVFMAPHSRFPTPSGNVVWRLRIM